VILVLETENLLRRILGLVARLAPLAVVLILPVMLCGASYSADHLVLTEFAVRPTDAEFVEIFNPTSDIIDLTNYYLTDYRYSGSANANYWHFPDVNIPLAPDPAYPNDFLAHFPAGTLIAPGQTIVIALHDDAVFTAYWSSGLTTVVPDFELIDDGSADGVPGMVDPGPAPNGEPYVQSAAGLSNGRELVVLFYWDGESDLLQDVDIVQWSDLGPDYSTLSPNKTGVQVDGPDPDTLRTEYLPDTDPQGQQVASDVNGAHDYGLTVSRINFQEGNEVDVNGNGITGHDETSENYSVTWRKDTVPTPGSPGEYGPPTLLGAASTAVEEVLLTFNRPLDSRTASDEMNYRILEVMTPGGAFVRLPLTVTSARLSGEGSEVRLTTENQTERALYEVTAGGILSQDLVEELIEGSRVFFRGYNPGPGLQLEVPHRPFVPHLDGHVEISYVAPQGERVLLRLYDPRGQEILVMAEETAPAGGVRRITWDGRDLLRQRVPAGLYYVHLELPGTGEETVAPLVVGAMLEEGPR
jgi:hypothetical protein